jgi:hypothetical protein
MALSDGKALHRNKSNAIFKFAALNRQADHPMLEQIEWGFFTNRELLVNK